MSAVMQDPAYVSATEIGRMLGLDPSNWYRGVRSGVYPPAETFRVRANGGRTRVWRRDDIESMLHVGGPGRFPGGDRDAMPRRLKWVNEGPGRQTSRPHGYVLKQGAGRVFHLYLNHFCKIGSSRFRTKLATGTLEVCRVAAEKHHEEALNA